MRKTQGNIREGVLISNYRRMAKMESGVFVRGNSMKKDIEISKYTERIRFGFNLKKYISKCLFKMTCETPSCKYMVKHDSIWTDIISSSFQPSVPVSLLLWISSMILSLGAQCPLSPTLSPSFIFFSLLPLPSFPFPPLLLSETAVRCYHWAWWNISATLNGGHRLRDSSLTADFQRSETALFSYPFSYRLGSGPPCILTSS